VAAAQLLALIPLSMLEISLTPRVRMS